jgi:predicted DNA binding CopG/RHH family protein
MGKPQTTDFAVRIGSPLVKRINAAALARGIDRSAFAEEVISATLAGGLPERLGSFDAIEGFRRDTRVLLRISETTAERLHARAEELQIPSATYVIFAFLGALEEPAQAAA